VAAELLDDLDAVADAGTQMGRALDQIALIEVIRPHAAHEQLVHEALHDVGIVVHAAQQHALIAQRHAVVGQQAQAIAHFGGQLARMIGVDAQPQRMVLSAACGTARA
jgi:hypothetical protein